MLGYLLLNSVRYSLRIAVNVSRMAQIWVDLAMFFLCTGM